MNTDNSRWRPVTPADLGWDASGAPRSLQFDDVYFSRDGALEESRQVFLEGNGLPGRWKSHPAPTFTIAETGFGTGLNFLLTLKAWRALPDNRPDLHYVSFEQFPLAPADLARALSPWRELEPLAALLRGAYPGLLPGQHRVSLEGGRVRLDLWWADAAQALAELAGRGGAAVDAWYLDGFAPARNAGMWTAPLLADVGRLSRPGATVATFTAAGQVRRDLQAAGFEMHKAPGYGRKRECLRGRFTRTPAAAPAVTATPWDLPATPPARPASALVIGAGLAGCSIAAALARRGVPVTVADRGAVAGAASGNAQGVLYTRLSRRHSALADFYLQAYQFALHQYRDLFARGVLATGVDGALTGCLQRSDDREELAAMAERLAPVRELAEVVDAGSASALVGVSQAGGGYWFTSGGWLRPGAVCRALLAHPAITVLQNCGDLALSRHDGDWQAVGADRVLASAPCAIVATGADTGLLPAFDWLPLQSIRGQTTQLPPLPGSNSLRAAVCHSGYIAPATAAGHCIGATFHIDDSEPALRADDHRHNLAQLAQAMPAWREDLDALEPGRLDGRVGFRCASRDYLPVVGPVPDVAAFRDAYAALRRNARRELGARGNYLPGLYLDCAHGSRGLASTPLAAELLASLVCGELPPLSRQLTRALSPARFIIRSLSRNRM